MKHSTRFAIILLGWSVLCSPLMASTKKALDLDFAAGQAITDLSEAEKAEKDLRYKLPGTQEIKLSLEDTILLALRYSPDVQSAQLQRIVDKYSLALQRYAFDIQYNLAASTNISKSEGGSRSSSSSVTPSATVDTALGTKLTLSQNNNYANGEGQDQRWRPNLEFELSQPLLSGFGTEYNEISLQNAIDQEVINRLAMRDSISSAVQAVISSYRTLIKANNNLTTYISSLKADQRTVEEDKALIKAGRKAPTDVANAEASVATDLLNIATQKNTISQNMQTLVSNIGLKPGTLIDVPSDVDVTYIPVPDVKESIELALKNSQSYQSGLTTLKSLERDLYQARQDARPTLDLSARTTYGNATLQSSGIDSLGTLATFQNSVGLTFNMAIDDFDDEAAIQLAIVAIQQQKLSILQTREAIETTIINDINDLISGMETVKQSENNLRLQQKAQDFLIAKGKFGLATTIDITDGQENVNSAKQSVIDNKISYLDALTAYYADMGVLLEKWNIELRY